MCTISYLYNLPYGSPECKIRAPQAFCGLAQLSEYQNLILLPTVIVGRNERGRARVELLLSLTLCLLSSIAK